MDSLRTAVTWLAVAVTAGCLAFVLLYLRTDPWGNRMGRHVLSFMATLLGAFLWAVAGLVFTIPLATRLTGWIITLTCIAVVVWWRVGLLIYYQRVADREERDRARGSTSNPH